MKYTQTIPCNDCPFRRDGGIRLTKSRAKEISAMMLDSPDGTFPCHKTTTESERKPGAHFYPKDHHIHCAGALIFAEKNNTATQMMRICERIGGYDPSKLMDDQETVKAVFDTQRQMIAAQKGVRS